MQMFYANLFAHDFVCQSNALHFVIILMDSEPVNDRIEIGLKLHQ